MAEAPSPGTLYLCATPIGNLQDVTLRLLETLREVDLIAAEDTRTTRKLLSRYDLHTPLTSYHEHNAARKVPALIQKLQAGQNIALVTEAGTPGLADPGTELVQAAVAAKVPLIPLPGPSAVLTALMVSGLPTGRFCFEGFLPRKGRRRRERLAELARETRTMVLYESPYRLKKTLQDLGTALGGARPVVIARELTKRFEEVWRGTLTEAQAWCEDHPPRGEYTLVLAGAVSTAAKGPLRQGSFPP